MSGARRGRARPSAGAHGIVTGNFYDKYGSRNPVVRRLMAGFERSLYELFSHAAPSSLLDVGCGEGVLSERLAQRIAGRRVVGVDLEERSIQASWARRKAANLELLTARAEQLPFADHEFDLVCAIELLEHLPDPEEALAEMTRCAQRHLLLSVPREPLWRALNLARGAYVAQLGNTPGHLNHWSERSLQALAARHGEVVATRSPTPWTMLLLRV